MFDIINNIYTKRDSVWIYQLDSPPAPIVLNKFLSMNVDILQHVRYLDKYTFMISPIHWIHLAWAVIPKYKYPPRCTYIKKEKNVDNYDEMFIKIKKILEVSEKDLNLYKPFLIEAFEKDKHKWFRILGMNKQFYELHGINKDDVVEQEIKGKGGLELWDM